MIMLSKRAWRRNRHELKPRKIWQVLLEYHFSYGALQEMQVESQVFGFCQRTLTFGLVTVKPCTNGRITCADHAKRQFDNRNNPCA